MSDHSPPLDAERFSRIEKLCNVRFNDDLRQSLNDCVDFWGAELARPYRYAGPKPPHFKGMREGSEKRRRPFMLELAAHFAIAGGEAKISEWRRGEKATAFELFLREIYGILPTRARPPTAGTFVRVSELLAATISERREVVMVLGFSINSGLKNIDDPVARAEYILEKLKSLRPEGPKKLIVV